MSVIDGRYEVAAHGTREMPVWGVVFTEEMAGRPTGVYEAIVRSRALADYLGHGVRPGVERADEDVAHAIRRRSSAVRIWAMTSPCPVSLLRTWMWAWA